MIGINSRYDKLSENLGYAIGRESKAIKNRGEVMNWEKDIEVFYERFKPKPVFSGSEDVEAMFNETIIPTLECIAAQLKLHAKNVKVKNYKYKAYLSFEDQTAKRSVFGVSVDLKYQTISFPTTLNARSTYRSGNKIKSRDTVDKDLIISSFMEFFKSREEEIKRHEREFTVVDGMTE